MNKEIKFARFVGISLVIICIIIVVLSLMSALKKSKDYDNSVDVENGTDYTLLVPKSNLVTESVNTEVVIEKNGNSSVLNIRLPKINIETDTVYSINEKIYSEYQQAYLDVSENSNIEKIEIDYEYEYIEDETVLEIIVTKRTIKDSENIENKIRYMYDLINDLEK